MFIWVDQYWLDNVFSHNSSCWSSSWKTALWVMICSVYFNSPPYQWIKVFDVISFSVWFFYLILFSYYKCFTVFNSDCVTNLSHFSSVKSYSGMSTQVWLKVWISGSINGWAICTKIAFRNVRKSVKHSRSIHV